MIELGSRTRIVMGLEEKEFMFWVSKENSLILGLGLMGKELCFLTYTHTNTDSS